MSSLNNTATIRLDAQAAQLNQVGLTIKKRFYQILWTCLSFNIVSTYTREAHIDRGRGYSIVKHIHLAYLSYTLSSQLMAKSMHNGTDTCIGLSAAITSYSDVSTVTISGISMSLSFWALSPCESNCSSAQDKLKRSTVETNNCHHYTRYSQSIKTKKKITLAA